jgi:hypothetical protein
MIQGGDRRTKRTVRIGTCPRSTKSEDGWVEQRLTDGVHWWVGALGVGQNGEGKRFLAADFGSLYSQWKGGESTMALLARANRRQ